MVLVAVCMRFEMAPPLGPAFPIRLHGSDLGAMCFSPAPVDACAAAAGPDLASAAKRRGWCHGFFHVPPETPWCTGVPKPRLQATPVTRCRGNAARDWHPRQRAQSERNPYTALIGPLQSLQIRAHFAGPRRRSRQCPPARAPARFPRPTTTVRPGTGACGINFPAGATVLWGNITGAPRKKIHIKQTQPLLRRQ